MAGPSYLEQYKTRYPQYQNVPDGQLAKAIYDQHYAKTMGWSEFTKTIGYDAPPTLPAQVTKAASRQPEAVKWEGNLPVHQADSGPHPPESWGEKAFNWEAGAVKKAALGVKGAVKLTVQMADRLLTGAIYHSDELATEIYDLARYGGFPDTLVSGTEKAIQADSYQAKGPGVDEITWLLHHPAHFIGEVSHFFQHHADMAAEKVVQGSAKPMTGAEMQSRAVLGAALKTAPEWLSLLLMTDNPMMEGIGKLTAPVREAAGAAADAAKSATRDALAKVADRTRFAGRVAPSAMLDKLHAYEKGIYSIEGQQLLVDHDATNVLLKDMQNMTPEDRLALEQYYNDKTGTYPLTDRQKSFATLFIDPMRNEVDMQPGYVPRVSLEHANFEVSAMRGEAEAARTKAYRHLSTDVDAFKSRGWYRLVPEDGSESLVAHFKQYMNPDYPGQYQVYAVRNGETVDIPTQRILPEDGTEAENPYHSPIGSTVADLKGNQYRIEGATREEITQHSGRKFVEDPIYTTTRAWHQIRTAQLTEMQKELTKRLLGEYIFNASEAPRGSVQIESRFFRGANNQPLYAPPPVARTIEAFMGNPRHGFGNVLRNLNHLILNASFAVPVWHDLNMVSIALMEKVPRMLEPESWVHYGDAMHEVLNVSGQFRELVGKGYPFWTPRLYAQTLHEVASNFLKESQTPHFAGLLSKTGIPLKIAQKGLKWYRDNVMHSVGPVSDVMTMSAIKERMAIYKEDLKTAANKVFRNMPTYRIRPTQNTLHAMQQSGLFWFLPYHVDRVRIIWNRVKAAAGGDPEALSRLSANVLMTTIIYPRLDQALREATNNPKAHIERFGANRIAADVIAVGEEQEPATRLLGDMITENGALGSISNILSSGYKAKRQPTMLEAEYGQQPLYPWRGQMEQLPAQLPIYPLQNYIRGGGGVKGAVLGQMGIFVPKQKNKELY